MLASVTPLAQWSRPLRPPTLDRCLLPEHPHAAAHDEQQAGQDDQDTAAAATHPRPARPLRVEEIAPAQEAASARSDTHCNHPLDGGERNINYLAPRLELDLALDIG